LSGYDYKRQAVASVKDMLTTVDEDIPVKFRPCDVSKETESTKLGKASAFDSNPNECLRHLPRRTPLYLITVFIWSLPAPWKEAGNKPCRNVASNQNILKENVRPISHLSTTGKYSKTVMLTRQFFRTPMKEPETLRYCISYYQYLKYLKICKQDNNKDQSVVNKFVT
jgi:hypothetical protein